MSYIRQMFETHPVNRSLDHAVNIDCITACYSCTEACNACADACRRCVKACETLLAE